MRLRLAVDTVDATGRTAGRLYSISTVGSLVGTFLAALLLIPFVGTRRTFLIFAGAMALAAVPQLTRGRVRAAVVPAAILALVALPTGTIKTADTGGDRVVWEAETDYQYARVLQTPDGERTLELDEGYAVHSVYRPGRWLTGNYWDEMLALSLAGGHAPPRSVAILGDAAGTSARQIGRYFPQTRIDAVELDGALTKVGRELFDLRGPNLHTYTADARPWLYATTRRYDVILVDAYRQPYIPFYLTTQEFFALVRDHLEPGGLVVVNVGHPQGSTSLEKALSATMRAAFGYDAVWRDPSRADQHHARRVRTSTDPGGRLRAAAAGLPADLSLVRAGRCRAYRAGTDRRAGVHGRPCPGGVAGRPGSDPTSHSTGARSSVKTWPPVSAGAIRPAAAGRNGCEAGRQPAAAARSRPAGSPAVEPTSMVLTGSEGSRQTALYPKAARIVALSAFSRDVEPCGWPTLTMTRPPGSSRSRTSAKNSSVVR